MRLNAGSTVRLDLPDGHHSAFVVLSILVPTGESIAGYGPFVMNTEAEIP